MANDESARLHARPRQRSALLPQGWFHFPGACPSCPNSGQWPRSTLPRPRPPAVCTEDSGFSSDPRAGKKRPAASSNVQTRRHWGGHLPDTPISPCGKQRSERLKCRWKLVWNLYESSFTNSRSTWGSIPRRNVEHGSGACRVPPLAKPILSYRFANGYQYTLSSKQLSLRLKSSQRRKIWLCWRTSNKKKPCGRLRSHAKQYQKDKCKNSWAPWEVSRFRGSTGTGRSQGLADCRATLSECLDLATPQSCNLWGSNYTELLRTLVRNWTA